METIPSLFSIYNFSFANDIQYMTGKRPNIFWLCCWKYISPAALLIIFVTNIVDLAKGKAKYAVYTGCTQVRNKFDSWKRITYCLILCQSFNFINLLTSALTNTF